MQYASAIASFVHLLTHSRRNVVHFVRESIPLVKVPQYAEKQLQNKPMYLCRNRNSFGSPVIREMTCRHSGFTCDSQWHLHGRAAEKEEVALESPGRKAGRKPGSGRTGPPRRIEDFASIWLETPWGREKGSVIS